MASYTVLLTDRNGVALGQVPPDNLAYERRLGGTGAASLRCRLDHPAISGPNRDNLDTWATELDVLRDGVPVFSGPVVSLDANPVDGYVNISAAAATHWLTRRYVLRDLFYDAEQVNILTALVAYAQDVTEKGPAAGFRLDTGTVPTGVTRQRTYLGAERPQVSDLVQQLAEVEAGFDLTLRLDRADGVTRRSLQTHHPVAGVDVATPLSLGRGGLVSLGVQRPGEQIATRVHAVGNGEGSSQLAASAAADENGDTVTSPALTTSLVSVAEEDRYGVHEAAYSATDVKDQTTLNGHAAGYLSVRRPPLRVVSASYRDHPATPFGFCDLGDRVTVQAERGWLHLSERLRVIAVKVAVGISGAETVELTFNDTLGG